MTLTSAFHPLRTLHSEERASALAAAAGPPSKRSDLLPIDVRGSISSKSLPTVRALGPPNRDCKERQGQGHHYKGSGWVHERSRKRSNREQQPKSFQAAPTLLNGGG